MTLVQIPSRRKEGVYSSTAMLVSLALLQCALPTSWSTIRETLHKPTTLSNSAVLAFLPTFTSWANSLSFRNSYNLQSFPRVARETAKKREWIVTLLYLFFQRHFQLQVRLKLTSQPIRVQHHQLHLMTHSFVVQAIRSLSPFLTNNLQTVRQQEDPSDRSAFLDHWIFLWWDQRERHSVHLQSFQSSTTRH